MATSLDLRARDSYSIPRDPSWTLVEDGLTLAREHEIESLFTVANGYSGTRGALVVQGTPLSFPATFLAGVFDRRSPDAIPELAVGPDWTSLRLFVEGHALRLDEGELVEYQRILDFRRGILWREWLHRDPTGRLTRIRGLRLASLADRHILLQSLVLIPENYTGRVRLEARIEPPPRHLPAASRGPLELLPLDPAAAMASPLAGRGSPLVLMFRTQHPALIAAYAAASSVQGAEQVSYRAEIGPGRAVERWDTEVVIGEGLRLDRLVAVQTTRDAERPADAALARLHACLDRGADGVIEAHVQAWEARWAEADVEIEGDDAAQRRLRFALYHLIAAANPEDERVSVGARGLTGEGYKGHVFWDTEIFMLPFYTLAYPAAARAMLLYRYHTLAAARQKAAAAGYRGALYAWESADTGEEATPTSAVGPRGEVIPILTGELEHHISADVAYAVWQYWQATGDDDFFRTAGAEILLETARFWASRAHRAGDGAYHIARVIGPDEYHEAVDDNAYTNLLAQWNLEIGAEAFRILRERWPRDWHRLGGALDLDGREPMEWRDIAQAMHTSLDAATGLFEQFAGYFTLEHMDLTAYLGRNMPLDVLLGREKVQGSQIVKQADVVLALYLLWDRLAPQARAANFRYYEPRTAHGSSLSPAIHAAVAARLGDLPLALRYFVQAAEIDLANNMGNASRGVHMAALGGLWQAVVMGFAGIRVNAGGVAIEPHLPGQWRSLRCPVQWRGRRLSITITQSPPTVHVMLEGTGAAPVRVGGGPPAAVEPGHPQVFEWRTD